MYPAPRSWPVLNACPELLNSISLANVAILYFVLDLLVEERI